MSPSIWNYSNILHKTCVKITEWAGLFGCIVYQYDISHQKTLYFSTYVITYALHSGIQKILLTCEKMSRIKIFAFSILLSFQRICYVPTNAAHTLSIWCRTAWSYRCPSDICKMQAYIWSRLNSKEVDDKPISFSYLLMINLFTVDDKPIRWW